MGMGTARRSRIGNRATEEEEEEAEVGENSGVDVDPGVESERGRRSLTNLCFRCLDNGPPFVFRLLISSGSLSETSSETLSKYSVVDKVCDEVSDKVLTHSGAPGTRTA